MKVQICAAAGVIPKYAKFGDAGMDVCASERITIPPFSTGLVPTGLYVAVPYGYEIQVRPRSGASLKTKLRVANTPGTIDSGYRGELKVIADNIGEDPIIINVGDRIAQIVLKAVEFIEWDVVGTVDQLPPSERGDGGFGSTGSN